MEDQNYIMTSLNEDEDALITSHFINDVLPETREYREFDLSPLLELVDNPQEPLIEKLKRSKKSNERQTEDDLIRPILEALGNQLKAQVRVEDQVIDFCIYTGKPSEFDEEYRNTNAIVESKQFGRIENNYYIKKEDNTDVVYQPYHYLDSVNRILSAKDTGKTVDYAILTDGNLWRLYSRNYSYSLREFQNHFLEFNLEAILGIEDTKLRNDYLRKFAVFFSRDALKKNLSRFQKRSEELQRAVTTELKEQTFTALEYIATALWRELFNPKNHAVRKGLSEFYGIDIDKVETDDEVKGRLLRLVYDESIVFLLRVLFVLYTEDRNLFEEKIPKVIKGGNGILASIIANNKEIGDIDRDITPSTDDDGNLKHVFNQIDERYNGGLFSGEKHQLIEAVNLDDVLFLNAIDNICRVKVKNKIYTVDFSTISARELGSIYESLLEYKLQVADKDVEAMPSILNKKRIRKNVKKGDLYLINQKGERKTTGSYYTPDLIVEHLVNTTLEPKLQKIKKEAKNYKDLLDQVLKIKICDPAMGSGHFLLGAYSRIIAFLRETLEEYREKGTETKITWNKKTAYEIRSHVARRCIFGVDLNENAVEIARMVLWMNIFRSDKPFEFFDTNLVCGNSLIGLYEDLEDVQTEEQLRFFETKERMESRIQKTLLEDVEKMMEMPRDTREEIDKIKEYYETSIEPLQKQIAFMLNMELAQYLTPELTNLVKNGINTLINGIDSDISYVEKILQGDPSIEPEVLELKKANDQIVSEFNPLHWRAVFPQIAVQGGFDIILSNPPWDKVKGYWHEFLADYSEDFPELIGKSERPAKEKVFSIRPELKDKWEYYNRHFEKENSLFNQTYKFQTLIKKRGGRAAKGDNNLFKLFMEKIYTILKEGGVSGVVVPHNLNIDAGTAGLRKLLFENSRIVELIMFENRMRVFKDVDCRYKFDVLTFEKRKSRKDATFKAGFYWYDPIWLDNKPTKEYLSNSPKSNERNHKLYKYPLSYIKDTDLESLTIQEFRDRRYIDIFKKINRFPVIGDENQKLYIKTYNDFHMTNDKDLFDTEEIGWPLYEGKMIHFYNIHLAKPGYFVDQKAGEERLGNGKVLWKEYYNSLDLFPSRTYRIAWRDVANSTDTRSLITTILPRGVFTGNTLNQVAVVKNGVIDTENSLLSGINVIFSSMTTDFFIRNRISLHISAKFLKSLPVPRNIQEIKRLGELAMPLYAEDEMEKFRGDVEPLTDQEERQKLMARMDAEVAHLYGLDYKEYQFILKSFPIVKEEYKDRCKLEFKEILFQNND